MGLTNLSQMLNQDLDPEIFEAFARLTQDEDIARDYYKDFLEAIKQSAFKSVDEWQDARRSLPRFDATRVNAQALVEPVV